MLAVPSSISAVVYSFCHCVSFHVCPGDCFILDGRLAGCSGKRLSFWLSACGVLAVVPLLWVRPSFSSIKPWMEGVR